MKPFNTVDLSSPRLHTIRTDEFLPPVSRWTVVGGFVLITGVVGAIALAALLRYSTTVRATATVRPEGGIRVVQSGLEGRIVSIEVDENQSVRQGDVLARLDSGSLETQQAQLQVTVLQLEAQLEQAKSQIRLLDAQLAAESQSVNQSVSVAQSELNQAQRALSEQYVMVQANLQEAEAVLALARSEMERYAQLVESGAVSPLQLEEKQAAVRTAEAQLARAQAALNPLTAPVAIAQDQVERQQAQGNASLALLRREREVLLQQHVELQNQLERDRRALQQLDAELQKTDILATSDGTIFRLYLRNPNQVVQVGETIAEIAPDTTALVIKAAVSTESIDQVQVGQRARMRITACPYPDFGTLPGQVVAVSPDVFVPENESSAMLPSAPLLSTTTYYEVSIQPDALMLTQGDRQCRLQPGMEAEASIISREETFLRYLLRKARLITNI